MSPAARRSSTGARRQPRGDRDEDHTLIAIRQARAGDSAGLRYLYLRYARRVQRYVRRIVMNEQDAEDVTQQVFLKLAIRMTCYEPGQAPFSAWLFRVARNSAIDHLRQTRPLVLDEPLNQELEAPGDDPELRRSLQEAIDGLTADQRDALVLREIRGLSPRETAACLGKTRRAVNTNYHRARLAAKDTLESLGAIPATRA